MAKSRIKCGVAGVGSLGQHHARIYAALPQAELVTLRNVDHFATPKDFGCIDATLDFLGAGL